MVTETETLICLQSGIAFGSDDYILAARAVIFTSMIIGLIGLYSSVAVLSNN